MTQTLSIAEMDDLKKLEKKIEAGKQTFVEVGLALTEIRDRRLYRKMHGTFEEYCQTRWGWTRQRGHQLMEAAAVVESLPSNLSTRVDTEKAARVLTKVEPAARAAVVTEAAKNRPVTARAIEVAATKVAPKSKDAVVLDKTGYPIPASLLKYWNRAQEVQDILSSISTIKGVLQRAMDDKDLMYWEIGTGPVDYLSRAWQGILAAKPYAVCTVCQGHPEVQPKGQCRMCGGRGLISEHRWKTVPEEIRKMRANEKGQE